MMEIDELRALAADRVARNENATILVPCSQLLALLGAVPRQMKEIPYWPYCPECKQPFDFEPEEPLAHCACGTSEWGYPRPAPYVARPEFKRA